MDEDSIDSLKKLIKLYEKGQSDIETKIARLPDQVDSDILINYLNMFESYRRLKVDAIRTLQKLDSGYKDPGFLVRHPKFFILAPEAST